MLNRRTLLILPFALAAAGCQVSGGAGTGGATPGTSPAANAPAGSGAGTLKVGLLTNGSLADSGWNSLAGKGLEQIKQELGAETSHQSAGEAEAEEALRGFARDKSRLVFAHGNEFGDAAKRVAQEFPDTVFVVSSGEVEGQNLASLKFELGEAAYLAGMASAALSKSGKAGQIGGTSIPPLKQSFALFEKGGREINPKFMATTTYIGNWHDANAGKEKALAMIRAGADVLFQNADAAGEGVFQAAEEHPGTLVIGSNANQNDLKPDLIAMSAVLDVQKTFMGIAREVKDGTFKGGVFTNDLKSGNVYLALNDQFKSRIPAEVLAKIQKAEADIKVGRLKLVGQ